MTITVNPLADVTVAQNAADTVVDLFNTFDDPKTTGLVAQFQLSSTLNDSFLAGSVTNVLLFDQTGAGAPGTVQNFQNYVNDGDYVNSIIHRSVSDFVVQGGGFNFQDSTGFGIVPTDAAIQNEFSSDRSNLRGTIAMAKVGSDPDSATSQWFFNLADNSANLDNQNGGFTVFGQVLSQADLNIIDAIANVPVFNASSITSAFSALPLISGDNNLDNANELVRYSSIGIVQQNELSFDIVSNSNPAVVSATISDSGQLTLDYQQGGTAELTIQATNLLGETLEDTFVVTVDPSAAGGNDGSDVLIGDESDNVLDGGGGNDRVLGLDGNDQLTGGSGRDRLVGGNGNDDLDGGGGRDNLKGGRGRDTLNGGGGNDRLNGGNGNDELDGGGGNDNLKGGKGNDTLDGGNGSDRLIGGRGRDTFVLRTGKGQDQIRDFADGQDRFRAIGFSFNDVTLTQRGRNTLITVDGDNVALVLKTDISEITAADFGR